jgi:hypothetical protein
MTNRRHGTGLSLAVLAMLLLPFLAEAQQRPSLSRLEEAICEKADADGDSFRPKLCTPRCDCVDAVVGWVASMDTCQGSIPGMIEAGSVNPAHDAHCFGLCLDSQTLTLTGEICSTPTECGTSALCMFSDPSSNDVTSCISPDVLCGSDADCATGFSCGGNRCTYTGSFSCPGSVPTSPITCATYPAELNADVTLVGMDVADTAAVVECQNLFGTTSINSNDALKCRDRIEELFGVDCP